MVFTQLNQPAAYFSTGTRLWEFVLGGLLALLITQVVIAKPVSHFLGISGVLVLVLFGWLCDVSTQFPGYMALMPCLAACAIIAAAYNGGYVPLAGSRFMVRLASYSFAFYLWHWPLLCFYRSWAGTAEVGVLPGLGIIGVSFVLAYISTRLFELPVRHSAFLKVGYKRTLGFAGAVIMLVSVPVAALKFTYEARKESAKELMEAYAAAGFDIPAGFSVPDTAYFPPSIIARKDRPKPDDDGCNQTYTRPEVVVCSYGKIDAAKVVALVGGSHSAQWFSALEMAANEFNFRLVNITKSGCALTLSDPGLDYGEAAWESCLEWNLAVLAKLSELKPDLVVTIGTRVVNGVEFVPDGYRMAWKWLEEAGVVVLALRDNPRFEFDIPYCLETHRDMNACGMREADYYGPENPLLSDTPPNVFPADFSDLYCHEGFCPPVIDNILIYRDKNHLTDTFVMRYHDVLEQAVVATGKVF